MIINESYKHPFKGRLVRDFFPKSHEENRCKDIALELGEVYMDYLLKILRSQGYPIIERAWGIYEEARKNGEKVLNPPAYFNGIIKKLSAQNN